MKKILNTGVRSYYYYRNCTLDVFRKDNSFFLSVGLDFYDFGNNLKKEYIYQEFSCDFVSLDKNEIVSIVNILIEKALMFFEDNSFYDLLKMHLFQSKHYIFSQILMNI